MCRRMLTAAGAAAMLLLAAGCGGEPAADGTTAAAAPPPAAAAEPGGEPADQAADHRGFGAAIPPATGDRGAADRDADRDRPTPDTLPQLAAGGTAAAFERYVAGPWYRLTDTDAPPDRPVEIIHFEPAARRITLFDGEVQEVYAWDDSERPRPRQLKVRMHNTLVTSIDRTISVEALTDDEVRLVTRGGGDDDDGQDATYRRLGERARQELARATAAQPGLERLDLGGIYLGSDDEWIRFDPPHFTWQRNGERLSGGFAVYSVDRPVLVLKVLAASGTTREVRAYTLNYREQRQHDRVLRSLVLHPATLEMGGVTAVGATALHLEQVEPIDVAMVQAAGATDR